MSGSSSSPGPSSADDLAMVPSDVGRVSRDWDDQHVDLRAACGQVAHAPTTGFTPRVAQAAADFTRAWTEHTGAAAELSEQQADALRAVIAAWVRTDEAAGTRSLELLSYLRERR